MLKNIKINSFRGLNNVKINDLKKVNLFVGKNNCGKTSVLEGIYLLTNPQSILELMETRYYYKSKTINLENFMLSLFKNMDMENNNISIIGEFLNNEKKLKKELNITSDLNLTEYQIDNNENIKMKLNVNVVYNGEENNNIKNNISIIDIYDSGISIKSKKPIKKYVDLSSKYITPYINLKKLPEIITLLIVNKNMDNIIKILQKIEPSIKNIIVGADRLIYCDIGKSKYMPINIMGDGFLKILYIMCIISHTKNGYVFIDEIENGFHYSALKTLWKGIFESSEKFNVQVFATTHSWECIKAYNIVYKEIYDKNNNDDIKLYRVEYKKNSHNIVGYNSEDIDFATNNNWEIR